MTTLQKLEEIKPILEVGKDSQEYLDDLIEQIDEFHDMAVKRAPLSDIDLYEIMVQALVKQGYDKTIVENQVYDANRNLTNKNYSMIKDTVIDELRSDTPVRQLPRVNTQTESQRNITKRVTTLAPFIEK